MVNVGQDLPVRTFASAQDWQAWLADEHSASPGLWLKIAKKGSGIDSVSYAEALDAALCFGWIDGQRKAFDASYFLQRFTPRTTRSKWSKVNCGKVGVLIERGLMMPAGLRAVEAAKADGRWDAAYDNQSRSAVPDDLLAALAANPTAEAFFADLERRNRFAILYRIQDAKKPETRARRIEKYVGMLAKGEKLYP